MASLERAPTTLSLDLWLALDEDEPGEWVDGLVEDEEVPSIAHEQLVGLLISELRRWLGRGAVVVGSESKLVLSERRGRKPDLAAWFPGSPRPAMHDRGSSVPPDVAVEIVSATPRDARRDRVVKHDEYAAFGVRYYWVVDPQLRTLEIYELRDGAYARVLGATDGSALPVPGIPGALLDLDAAWAEIADEPPTPD